MSGIALWAALGSLGLLLGVCLVFLGRNLRTARGLGDGRTVSLDQVTLTSRRYGLIGRPDRIIRSNGSLVIEEWKSARRLQPWHRAQLGVYFLLAEEQLGERPTHGFLVTGDGRRHRVENDEVLRGWVLAMAAEIRGRREVIDQASPVHPEAWQCRACGMRGRCRQANAR